MHKNLTIDPAKSSEVSPEGDFKDSITRKRWLGEDPATGQAHLFRFRVMPFGLATAARTMTRITKPLVQFLSGQGIRHVIYIDDGRVLSSTRERCRKDYRVVMEALRSAGFKISRKKTDSVEDIAQVKEYLGFVFNSVQMTVHVPEKKLERLSQRIKEFLEQDPTRVKPKDLASVVGIISSAAPALGRFAAVFVRSAQAELAKTEEQGWNKRLNISGKVVEDLLFLRAHLWEWNGHPIKALHSAVTLTSLLDYASPHLQGKVLQGHPQTKPAACMAGDASAIGMCAFAVQGLPDVYVQGEFSEEERGFSSGHRELLTVLRTLQQKGSVLSDAPRPRTVYWLTDSTNMEIFLRKGSGKAHIQEVVTRVYKLCQALHIHLEPVQVTRQEPLIDVADAGSRHFEEDDWGIDIPSFRDLEARFGRFTVDLFAGEGNHKVDKFYSVYATPSSSGVDAFARDWTGEHAFICPPVRDIIPAWRKSCNVRMSGVLVVPEWRSSSFWPMLFPDGHSSNERVQAMHVFQPFIIQGQFAKSPVMKGFTPFLWRALFFDNK